VTGDEMAEAGTVRLCVTLIISPPISSSEATVKSVTDAETADEPNPVTTVNISPII
jgi:hypothetical protein